MAAPTDIVGRERVGWRNARKVVGGSGVSFHAQHAAAGRACAPIPH